MKLVKLKDICEFEKGSTGLAKAEPGEYPLVATSAERKSSYTYQFDTKAVCIPLVSSTGHGHASLKKVHYQEGKFALGSILVALTTKDKDKLDIQFLHLYLSQLKDQVLVPLMSGAANVALSVSKIHNIEIPLPSLEKQQEIVRKFKSIVREEDELKSELNYQQILLKNLRQQILQEAVEGKLTAEWRANNPDVEPASELLKRIDAEKSQLINDKKIKLQKPQQLFREEERPFELPYGWLWCLLEDLSLTIHYGANKSANWNKNVVRLLRITDIQRNKVDWESVPGCGYSDGDLVSYGLSENDILIARTGGTIGKSYIVKNLSVKSIFASYLIRIIPSRMLNANYLKSFIESPTYWLQLYEAAWGAGQPNVNGTNLKGLFVPLPSLPEQKAIVTKVEKLFAICDQLEEQFNKNQFHAEQLMQAVLKEAFSQNSNPQSTLNILEEVGA